MRRTPATRQRGAALLIMVMIVGLGATWYLVSRLNTESGLAAAAVKARNQRTLNTAKAALIGYVAAQAIKAGENRPGALPCPVAGADFNDPLANGSDGTVSYPCTLPIVGRFPWRTLGLDKLVDASGEPLWYAVATGWAGANTVINSDCASPSAGTGLACSSPGGRLSVDGVTSDVIALIIAPGPRLNVSASANCTAWNQARSATGTPDARNYLECQNATWPADATFATTGPGGSFNDQVVAITVADILPGIEAAIAKRIEREIVPALNTVYKPSAWGFSGADPVVSPAYADGYPLYPWAATFDSPGPGAVTANYLGASGTYQGLLPFNQTNCTASASNPRCQPTLISWQGTPANAVETFGFGYIQTQTCSWQSGTDIRECTGEYHEDDSDPTKPIRLEMTATLNNVAMGLRAIDTSGMTVEARDDVALGPWQPQAVTYTATMNPNGSVTLRFGATMPNIDVMGWGTYAQFRVRLNRTTITDHLLLDTADATTGWFARNEWYRLLYYAVARGFTADSLAAAGRKTACPTSTSTAPIYPFASTCLSVANVLPANSQRAILILAGRSINGNPRPSAVLADYLEFGNRTGGYEVQTIAGAVASAYTDTGSANAYSVATPVTIGKPFQFKAVNANSGASTLAATGVSATNLVNADGSPLSASQIQAGAVSEVAYDGTRFKLYKRPFNDRLIVIGSN
jgi:hypothetical protein